MGPFDATLNQVFVLYPDGGQVRLPDMFGSEIGAYLETLRSRQAPVFVRIFRADPSSETGFRFQFSARVGAGILDASHNDVTIPKEFW